MPSARDKAAHAHLGCGEQADDAHTRRVGQRLEEFAHARGGDAVDEMLGDKTGVGSIGMGVGADSQTFTHD